MDRRELSGYDGYDIYNCMLQCWVSKETHKGQESWVGPVALNLNINMMEPTHGGDADSPIIPEDSQPYMPGDSPDDGGMSPTGKTRKHVLRLFMKHKYALGLEKFLQEEELRAGSQNTKQPRAKKLLGFVKGLEKEELPKPGVFDPRRGGTRR